MVITTHDCGTERGLLMQPIIEGGDVVEPLRERILGRVAAVDVMRPGGDEVVCEAGTLLDEGWVDALEEAGVDQVMVSSPITCETRQGIIRCMVRTQRCPEVVRVENAETVPLDRHLEIGDSAGDARQSLGSTFASTS